MSPKQTISNLLAGTFRSADNRYDADNRKLARAVWATTTIAELKTAQKRADKAWERLLPPSPLEGGGRGEGDDENLSVPPPPGTQSALAEQAEVDALHAAIMAVANEDRWPRHLHFPLV